MAYQQETKAWAESKRQKPFFPFGMRVVIEFNGIFIKEDRLPFLKSYSVLLFVCTGFMFIPTK